MAKILFVQHELMELLGVMCISSFVKRHGHKTTVFIPGTEEEFLRVLRRERPDAVGFTCSTGLEDKLLRFAQIVHTLKSSRPLVIFGGPHPTFYPEMIEHPAVDVICRGQGEIAVLEVLKRMDQGAPVEGIGNLWVKRDGTIQRNPQAELISDFDELPFPDRDLYQAYEVVIGNPTKHFITLRECPFDCAFCFNHAWKAMHPKHPAYRNRRPESIIKEIKEVCAKYPTKIVLFWDGTFNLNRKWLRCFLDLYRQEVGIPFRCNLRADLADEETVKGLKQSGCSWVKLGLESGNQNYRNNVLNKGITDEDFIRTSHLLHKHRIPFSTFNMLGLPGETLDMAMDTLRLNMRLKPQHSFAFVYLPFPRTKLGQYALDEGYIETPKIGYEYADSFKGGPLKLKDKDQIENLQKFFALATQFPVLAPLVRLLIKLPPNRAFILIERISRFLFFWCRHANSPGVIPALKEFLYGFGFRRNRVYRKLQLRAPG